MKINGRLAADIIFMSDYGPKRVSLPILARMLIERIDEVKGSLEIKSILLEGKFNGNKSAIQASQALSQPRNTAYEISYIRIRVVYKDTQHATMKEIYRTARVLEEAANIILNITLLYVYINLVDDEHMIFHRLAAYSDNQINDGLLQRLTTVINDNTNDDDYKKMFNEFDYGSISSLDYQVVGVFNALGYDFRKHHVMIRDDYDSSTITLTIPEGKSASDKEITKIYNIFKEYIYPRENGLTPNFKLIINGELTHTKPQLWETDPNFKIINKEEYGKN